MADERYQGWTNHSTWCVNLWWSNDAALYVYWTKMAESITSAKGNIHADGEYSKAALTLAEVMKEDLYQHSRKLFAQMPSSSVYGDLLEAAMSDVNFREIAQHWTDDATE